MLGKKSDDAITQLKDKVRSLCLQNDPSEPLILLTLEELARVSRRQGHADAELYEELTRQAKVQRGQLDLAYFFVLRRLVVKQGTLFLRHCRNV